MTNWCVAFLLCFGPVCELHITNMNPRLLYIGMVSFPVKWLASRPQIHLFLRSFALLGIWLTHPGYILRRWCRSYYKYPEAMDTVLSIKDVLTMRLKDIIEHHHTSSTYVPIVIWALSHVTITVVSPCETRSPFFQPYCAQHAQRSKAACGSCGFCTTCLLHRNHSTTVISV
jgi:hypothetical protein